MALALASVRINNNTTLDVHLKSMIRNGPISEENVVELGNNSGRFCKTDNDALILWSLHDALLQSQHCTILEGLVKLRRQLGTTLCLLGGGSLCLLKYVVIVVSSEKVQAPSILNPPTQNTNMRQKVCLYV